MIGKQRPWEATWFEVRSLARYGARALLGKRVRRDHSWIQAEYDRPRRTEEWRSDISIEDLILGDTRPEYVLLHDRLQWGSERQVRQVLLSRLREEVSKLVGNRPNPVIVEAGCGTGRNLFFLARMFPTAELVGYELTSTTVEHARERANVFGGRVTIEQRDLTRDPLPTAFDVAYSVHALEQLGTQIDFAVSEMMRAACGAIFLEPCNELAPKNLRGAAMRMRLRNAGYLSGLYDSLIASGAPVQSADRLGIGRNPLNETCAVVVAQALTRAST